MSEPVYTPNSHKYKEEQKLNATASEEKRVQKVVKGPVKTKKNEIRKLADILISEDVKNVKEYIFMDVLVPAVKKAIYDIVTNGIDMFLYGGKGGNKASSSGAKVSYRNYYDQKNNPSYRGSENVRNHNGFEYDDIVFSNRGEAEAVKQQMMSTIGRYGVVTVADLYDMADLSAPYTSQKYGWMDVSNAEVRRERDGYSLKLPRPVPID
jgi:hypothetical protein